MSTLPVDDILEQALRLSSEDRTTLVARLIASFDAPNDPEVEAAWIAECERRWHEIQRGEMEVLPGQPIIDNLMAGREP